MAEFCTRHGGHDHRAWGIWASLSAGTLGDKGGALDWTDLGPGEILDGIRDLGDGSVDDPVTFVAHPRDGLLGYFDQYGFDPYTGTDSAVVEPNFINASANELIDPGLFTMEFDAMEILNAKR